MARSVIELEEIEIPNDVDVDVSREDKFTISILARGPRGELKKSFRIIPGVFVERRNNKVLVYSYFPNRRQKALVGTLASHIRNMVKGVREGFVYKMKVVYSHFPISLRVEGDKLVIENFLGENHPRFARILPGVNVEIEEDIVIVSGIDKEAVGQTAANIEQATRIKRKDPRVFQDGIYLIEKDGVPI